MHDPPLSPLCDAYTPLQGAFDEMCEAGGGIRKHWAYLAQTFQSLGSVELQRREHEARRLLRENGVTYNVYGDPRGADRLWELDPIPLLIGSEEWAEIESGLIQRAELLNLILKDLYGPRELIHKGLLPPEFVFGHEGFLRPCTGITVPGLHQLVIYAVDLARGSDGQIWVLGDRTQAPSGAGYALENRMVISRIFPSLYRDSQVHRLALFFRTLRASLASMAPTQERDPRVIILTPGPHNETYFEHSYLAAYLGYTVAQGSDLVVNDGRLWLRSPGSQEAVDVVLRRVDDHFCDPLELRPDSRLGVAGLVEVTRRGAVAVVNRLGSSVLENPALMAFLPGLAKHFLGQPLKLPSVATWWCGQRKEREFVLTHLKELVIKPIYRHAGVRSVFGAQMNAQEMERWRARIRERPHLYVGQEQVSVSSVPTLVNGLLAPRHALLRTFLVARDHDYVVMPGGLTRVGHEPETFLISSQAGGTSKDTWVLATEPEKPVSLWLHERQLHATAQAQMALPSGAADNLFWLGRYAERCESTIRLLRAVFVQLNETEQTSEDSDVKALHALLEATTHLTRTYPGFVGDEAAARRKHPEEALLRLILDESQAGSLATNLHHVLRTASAVRDRLPAEMWRIINDVKEKLDALRSRTVETLEELAEDLDHILTHLMALMGLTVQSMTRGAGWNFLEAGRRLEQALQLMALLRPLLVPARADAVEQRLMESVLSITQSLVNYRRRYRGHLQLDALLDLLVFEENNPRSLDFQISQLKQHLAELPRPVVELRFRSEERDLLQAVTLLSLSEAAPLVEVEGESQQRQALEELLVRLTELLVHGSDALTQTYFVDVRAQQQFLGSVQSEP